MNYVWFKIFNKAEFEALDLVSKTYTLVSENIGRKDFLVTKANYLGITYEGKFLALDVNDKNPLEFEDHAIYLDDNDDVWYGVEV